MSINASIACVLFVGSKREGVRVVLLVLVYNWGAFGTHQLLGLVPLKTNYWP